MKESKTLIIGLAVFVVLVLVVAGTYFSGREVLFAEEPNEPECITEGYTFHIWEPNDICVVSLDFIPTWPDYIELEKDLVLRYDFPEPNNPSLIHIPSEFRIIGKGTKIYFK